MTLKEYARKINKLLIDHPEAKDYMVVYSVDEEGNNFTQVHFDPSIGEYDNGFFATESSNQNVEDCNAVCIN